MDVLLRRTGTEVWRRWWLALAVLLPLWAMPASACPFCSAPAMTLGERYGRAEVVLVVLRTGEEKPTPDKNGRTTFQVVQSLREQANQRWKVGDAVTLEHLVPGSEGERFLLLGTTTEKLAWDTPVPLTNTLLKYILEGPRSGGDAAARLTYFLRFLEHSEQTIANDAYAEFANARYEDIVRIAPQIPREKTRSWLLVDEQHPGKREHRFGLYGLLLGLCGNESDARFLEERILEEPEDMRLGIDGMMAGYLLLKGEAGLAVIERAKLRNSEAIEEETYAALQAIRFLWTYAPSRVPPARLMAALRILLDKPQFAELAIRDLARCKDWSIQGRLLDAYEKGHVDGAREKRVILGYFFAASHDVNSNAGGEVPEHVRQARAALARLKKLDPETYKQAEKFEMNGSAPDRRSSLFQRASQGWRCETPRSKQPGRFARPGCIAHG